MGIPTDLFLQTLIHIMKPLTFWREIDKCSPICLSVHPSGRLSFFSIPNHILSLSIILHRRRKVLNIGGGGGGTVAKLFAGCKLIGAPVPNQCQINAFLTLKTDNIPKLRIEIKSILLAIT